MKDEIQAINTILESLFPHRSLSYLSKEKEFLFILMHAEGNQGPSRIKVFCSRSCIQQRVQMNHRTMRIYFQERAFCSFEQFYKTTTMILLFQVSGLEYRNSVKFCILTLLTDTQRAQVYLPSRTEGKIISSLFDGLPFPRISISENNLFRSTTINLDKNLQMNFLSEWRKHVCLVKGALHLHASFQFSSERQKVDASS